MTHDFMNSIVEALKAKNLTLVLGPGVAVAMYEPEPAGLLADCLEEQIRQGKLNVSDLGMAKAFRISDDVPRLFKLLQRLVPDELAARIREKFAEPPSIPGPYADSLRRLASMGFAAVVTPNLSPLYGRIFSDYRPLTWRDGAVLAEALEQPILLQLKGNALRPETLCLGLDEQQALAGAGGEPIRQAIKRLAKRGPALWLGFANDYSLLVTWLAETGAPNFLLDVDQVVDLPGLQTIPCPQGLDHWLDRLLLQLDRSLSHVVIPRSSKAAQTWTQAEILALPQPSQLEIEAYFAGGELSWSLVRAQIPISRKLTPSILDQIKGPSASILLRGPSCEGKTTLLRQLSWHFIQQGYSYMASDDRGEVSAFFAKPGPKLLHIERAHLVLALPTLLKWASLRKDPTLLLLESRQHAWQHSYGHMPEFLKSVRIFDLGPLRGDELATLAQRLHDHRLGFGRTPQELHRLLIGKVTQHYLLAALLEVIKQHSFADILKTVVDEIADWVDGAQLLQALAITTLIESLPTKSKVPFQCPLRLICDAMDLDQDQITYLCERLKGEVNLVKVGESVITRSPLIARTLYPILITRLDERRLNEQVVRAAARLSYGPDHQFERNLLTIIPSWLVRRDQGEQAEHLLGCATEVQPYDAPTWQMWARLVAKRKHFGALTEPYSPRWLFKRATEADPNHAPSWQAWAVMEAKHDPGALDLHYSARWLFKRATEADPNHAPSWQAWAAMEAKYDPGALDLHYSARWLFKRATEADPKDLPTWRAWIQAEHTWDREVAKKLVHDALIHLPKQRELIDLLNYQPHDRPNRPQAVPPASPTRTVESPPAAPAVPVSTVALSQEQRESANGPAASSAYACYLAAQSALDSDDPDQVLKALARIAPHLKKRVILGSAIARLDSESEHLLAVPGKWLTGPKATVTCFAVTRNRRVYRIEVPLLSAESLHQNPVPTQIDALPISLQPTQVLGLYRHRPRRSKSPEIWLVHGKGHKVEARVYSLDPRNPTPTIQDKVDDWMCFCPVTCSLDTDPLLETDRALPPREALMVALFNNRTEAVELHQRPGFHKGLGLSVLGPWLLVLETDQKVKARDTEGNLAWTWKAGRQPVALCPLAEGEQPQFLVAFENGDLCVATVLPPDWSQKLWSGLADRFRRMNGVTNHEALANWMMHSSGIKRNRGLRSACMKLLFESMIAEEIQAVNESHLSLFLADLDLVDWPIPLSVLEDVIASWESGSLRGCQTIQAIYQGLPIHFRDGIDRALKCLPLDLAEGSAPLTEVKALHVLMKLRDITRPQLLLSETDPTTKAAVLGEAYLHRSWLTYLQYFQLTGSCFLFKTQEPSTCYLVHPGGLERFNLSGTFSTTRMPLADWQAPTIVCKSVNDAATLEVIGHGKLFRIHHGIPSSFPLCLKNRVLLRATSAGNDRLFLLVIPQNPRCCELWLYDLNRGKPIAKRRFAKQVPNAILSRPLTPDRWFCAWDSDNDKIHTATLSVQGDRLVFINMGHRQVLGKVRCLACEKSGDDYHLLVGTNTGHLFNFNFSDEKLLHLRWMHYDASSLRHLDTHSHGGGYWVLTLSAFGQIGLLDQDGSILWTRRIPASPRSGTLVSRCDGQPQVVILDSEGFLYLFEPPPADSLQQLQTWIDHPSDLLPMPDDQLQTLRYCQSGQIDESFVEGCTAAARACFLACHYIKTEAPMPFPVPLKLKDFETLAFLQRPAQPEPRSIFLLEQLIHLLGHLDRRRDDRDLATYYLVNLLRQVGWRAITPEWVRENEGLWAKIPPDVRDRPEVNLAVLLNGLDSTQTTTLTQRIAKASYLGPAGFQALRWLVNDPEEDLLARQISDWIQALLEGQERTGEKILGKDPDPRLALHMHSLAFLVHPDPSWHIFTGLGELAIQLTSPDPQEAFHPDFQIQISWLKQFSVDPRLELQTLEEQRKTLFDLESLEIDANSVGPLWFDWIKEAKARLIQRRAQVIAGRRAELQVLCRVRLEDLQAQRLPDDKLRINFRLVREGFAQTDLGITLSIAADQLTPIEQPLDQGFTWHQLPNEPQQWLGRLTDPSLQQITLVVKTGSHCDHWPLPLVQAASVGRDLLDVLPQLKSRWLSKVQTLMKSAIFAYDPEVGGASLHSEFTAQPFLRLVNLDAKFKQRGPGRREPTGFDAHHLLTELGFAMGPSGSWHMTRRGLRAILVHHCQDTLERLLLPDFAPIWSELCQAFREDTPMHWLLPLDLATRLQMAMSGKLAFVSLYHLEEEDWQDEGLVQGLANHWGRPIADLIPALNLFHGNLRILRRWQLSERDSLRFVKETNVQDLFFREELAGLQPLDVLNLYLLAHATHGDSSTQPRASGYPMDDDQAIYFPPTLHWLYRIGRTNGPDQRHACHKILQERRVLKIVDGIVSINEPYQSWLTQLGNAWKPALDQLFGGDLFKSLPFEVLANHRGDLMNHGMLSQAGALVLEKLNTALPQRKTEPWQAVLAEITGGPALRSLPEGLAALPRQNPPLTYVHWTSARERLHLCLCLPHSTLPSAQALQNWASQSEPAMCIVLAPLSKITPDHEGKANLCLIDEQRCRDLLFSQDPARHFALLIRNQSGLAQFQVFQVGNALPEESPSFVGREREIQAILARFRSESFLILGGRQIGKTSLLRHIHGRLKKIPDITPLYLSCEGITTESGFLDLFLQACHQAGREICQGSTPIQTIEGTLLAWKNPVLLINEVDGLSLSTIPMLQRLRALSEEQVSQFIMVGHHGAHGATNHPDHPMYHWTKGIDGRKALFLGALSQQAAFELIDKLEHSELALQWESEQSRKLGRDFLYDATYGIPILLQGACARLVRHLDDQHRFVIRLQDVTQPPRQARHPAWDYVSRIKISVFGAQNPDPRENAWAKLVLATAVWALYHHPSPPPIAQHSLDRDNAPDYHFKQSTVTSHLEELLLQDQRLELLAGLRRFFEPAHYKYLLDSLTLTVILSPSYDHPDSYYFQDHLYPKELSAYLMRNDLTMTKYLKECVSEMASAGT